MNGNRGRYAFAPLNNMKNKRTVQAAAPAARGEARPKQEEPVRRSGVLSLVVTLVLPVLFVIALLWENTPFRLIFLAVTAIAVLAMWVMKIFARDARSTLSIAYVALMVVIGVALGLQTAQLSPPDNTTATQAAAVQDWTTPHYASSASATPVPGQYEIGQTPVSDAQKQLENFILGWRENSIEKMLPMCAPSWVAKQQSPDIELWNIMRNREPLEYKIESVQGSEADSSRVITVKITFENQGTGAVSAERIQVLMFRINDTWYVDPQSLSGTAVNEAAEQQQAAQNSQWIQTTKSPVTPTPKPTGNDALQLYYNPDGGRYYHSKPNCPDVAESYWPLSPFYYGDLNTQKFVNLIQCSTCNAPSRP